MEGDYGYSVVPEKKSNKWIYILISSLILILIIIVVLVISLSSNSISDEKFSQGSSFELKEGKKIKFNFNDEKHTIKMDSVSDSSVSLIIQSNPIEVDLEIGEEKEVNLDSDDFYDLKIRLNDIVNKVPELYIKKINLSTCVPQWDCGNWSICSNLSDQTRTCNDTNSCGIISGKPVETQNCNCVEEWNCSSWTPCTGDEQTRECIDLNSCEANKNESKDCDFIDCGIFVVEMGSMFGNNSDYSIENLEEVYGCVAGAAENCELAKYKTDTTYELLGISGRTIDYFELRGLEEGKCVYYLIHEDISLEYGDELIDSLLALNYTQSEIDSMEEEAQNDSLNSVGDEGICLFDTSDLYDMFVRWSENNISSGVSCSGPLDNVVCVPTGDLEVAECSGYYWGGTDPSDVHSCVDYNFRVGVSMDIGGKMIGPVEILNNQSVIFTVDDVAETVDYLETSDVNGAIIKNLGVNDQMVSFEVDCI
tara:strand:- start:581 stop:2017 length:1437 start_codon:yes stop_codon:yes gene_type:complete